MATEGASDHNAADNNNKKTDKGKAHNKTASAGDKANFLRAATKDATAATADAMDHTTKQQRRDYSQHK